MHKYFMVDLANKWIVKLLRMARLTCRLVVKSLDVCVWRCTHRSYARESIQNLVSNCRHPSLRPVSYCSFLSLSPRSSLREIVVALYAVCCVSVLAMISINLRWFADDIQRNVQSTHLLNSFIHSRCVEWKTYLNHDTTIRRKTKKREERNVYGYTLVEFYHWNHRPWQRSTSAKAHFPSTKSRTTWLESRRTNGWCPGYSRRHKKCIHYGNCRYVRLMTLLNSPCRNTTTFVFELNLRKLNGHGWLSRIWYAKKSSFWQYLSCWLLHTNVSSLLFVYRLRDLKTNLFDEVCRMISRTFAHSLGWRDSAERWHKYKS